MKNLNNKNTKNDIRVHLLAVAIIGILASVVLFSAISEVSAKPISSGINEKQLSPTVTGKNISSGKSIKPTFATPGSITVDVKVAKKKISLHKNTQQKVTSTVNDEFGAPVKNVQLSITVTTPSGSKTFNRTTSPDGTDILIIPLSEKGKYTADVVAHNPNPGVGDAQGSTNWTVSK